MPPIAWAVVPAKSSLVLMGRILGTGGQLVTTFTVAALSYWVRDLTAGVDITTAQQALVVANCVFNQLTQNDVRWTRDSAQAPGADGLFGYNFLAAIPGTWFTAYDQETVNTLTPQKITSHTYQVDVRFVMADGSIFTQPFKLGTVAVYGGD